MTDCDCTSSDCTSSSQHSELKSTEKLTNDLSQSAERFGRSITNAFAKGIVEGRRFEDVLRSVGKSMTENLLKTALKPLQDQLSGMFDSVTKGASGLFGLNSSTATSAASPAVSLPIWPFAEGGVIASPAYFPIGRGLGLMGERGAEAIMPLSRGPDGKLGVRAGGGEAGRPLSVTVQVTTPDADSFRRSEAQVSAAIARAVARGSRAL